MKAWLLHFLFQPVDARATAWFRIALGLIIPWFFWSEGIAFSSEAPDWLRHARWSFLLSFPYWIFITLLSLTMAVGCKPRCTALVLCLALLPLDFLTRGAQSRQVLLFALFAFSFLKSGTIRAPWKHKADDPFSSAGPAWPLRLIQLQLTLLYGINAVKKTSTDYLSGDALMAMSAMMSNFKVDLTSGYLVLWGISIPLIIPAVASTLSEYFLALGFWFVRRKWLVALFGIVFHLALTQIVQIFKLDLVSMFLYLAFILPFLASSRKGLEIDIAAADIHARERAAT